MSFLSDDVLDNGLARLVSQVDEIHICSAEPTTYAEATSTYSLGKKTAPTIGAIANRTGGGREVEAAAFADGNVTATGTATHFAWVNAVGTVLYTAQALSASQAVTNGNTFSLDAHAVGIPDAA